MNRRDVFLDLLAVLAGVCIPLSLSPFDFWFLALLAPALLFAITATCSRRRVLLRFYLFNVGMFGAGVSWIYVSIYTYGGASILLAALLVFLLVLSYSLLGLPLAWFYSRYLRNDLFMSALAFCGLWIMQEWIRSWLLTGFPWLYLGYGLMETPLVNIASITGVYGLSMVACVVGTMLYVAAKSKKPLLLVLPAFTVLLAIGSGLLVFTKVEKEISVSLIQGNIDQHVKWLASSRRPILNHYLLASESEWGRDLIIWPEASLTYSHEQAGSILDELDRTASSRGSTVVLGIPDRDEEGGFQNTVIALGEGSGQYVKRRLVPFGEYMPLDFLLRGVIQIFDLPMSRNRPGPWQQPALEADGLKLSTSICYEVIYPELVRQTVEAPDLLVTVSNDTWFGDSIGPWQHMQMARMRAIENGRSLARATNNGLTALINSKGEMTRTLPRFKQGILRGDLEIRSGLTPYKRFGSYPVLLLSFLLIGAAFLHTRGESGD